MSKKEDKKAIKTVKSLQELRQYLLEHKKSYSRTALLTMIDNEIKAFKNPNEHSLIIRMTKDDALKFLKFNDILKSNKEMLAALQDFENDSNSVPKKIWDNAQKVINRAKKLN